MRRPVTRTRFLAGQAILGTVLGWSILAGLVVLDVAGLGTLLRGSEAGPLALSLLAFQFGAGFLVFVTATSLALLPDPDRVEPASHDLRPVPIRVRGAVDHRRPGEARPAFAPDHIAANTALVMDLALSRTV
jgi:hypothetical protein